MKIAVVGSRNIMEINIEKYISNDDEIVSGGAKGGDSCAGNMREKEG